MVQKNYNMMDVTKFLSAILLVCAHTASERVDLPTILDLMCSLYIIAVPFFFIASAFLFFKKTEVSTISNNPDYININIINRGPWIRWSKRIGLMYLSWSLIYFCFVVINWYETKATCNDILDYFHKALVFSTYSTIWFLPALWIAVSLVYVLRYKLKLSISTIVLIALLVYIIGYVEYSYHSLNPIMNIINDGYKSVMKTWRNGFFYGFMYAATGLMIANKGIMSKRKGLLGTCIFGFAFLVEAFAMKRIVSTSDANFIVMLVPFSYFFFNLICSIELPDSANYVSLRKMSMLIFLSQRLFLSAIPSVVGVGCIAGAWELTNNDIVALLLVVLEVVAFSYLLMKAEEKVKVLKYLM